METTMPWPALLYINMGTPAAQTGSAGQLQDHATVLLAIDEVGRGGMEGSAENIVDASTVEEQRVEAVARAFVDHYYNLFDTSRPALAALYHPMSMLSFEGQKARGAEEIARRLAALPFDRCRHHVSTVDCQPSPAAAGGILVFVSGSLQLPGEAHQLRFSQMFQLIPIQQGSFFVQNDIFRLIYG